MRKDIDKNEEQTKGKKCASRIVHRSSESGKFIKRRKDEKINNPKPTNSCGPRKSVR